MVCISNQVGLSPMAGALGLFVLLRCRSCFVGVLSVDELVQIASLEPSGTSPPEALGIGLGRTCWI